MAIRLHYRVRMALRSFLRRRTAERELDEELRFHFQEMETRAHAGESTSDEAHGRVPRRLGRFDQAKEACRDARTLRPLEDLLRDLRFGARLLARSPSFTVVAIVSLALGIGASSAIFSLINAIVLRALPVDQPEQLYVAQVARMEQLDPRFSYPAYRGVGELVAERAEVAAVSSIQSMQIGTAGSNPATAESAEVQLVAGDYFSVLRQHPQIGRLLGPGDNRTLDDHPVAVISDAYWSRKFGRATNAVGRVVIVNGTPVTIVGVTAPRFFGTTVGTRNPDMWVPIMMQAAVHYASDVGSINGDTQKPWPPQREVSWLDLFLRMPADAVPAVSEAMTLAMQRDYAQRSGYRDEAELRRQYQSSRVVLTSGSRGLSSMRDDLTTPLLVLFGMVALLLTIACANIASLLLARATNRHREMAIRLSIGAGRERLMRQLLTESLLLSLIGGALGLVVAYWGSSGLLTLANDGTRVTALDVRPDWRVLGFALAVSLSTGLVFGLLPAQRSTRVQLADALKAQTRGAIGSGGSRVGRRWFGGRLLVAGQMAFSLLLLIVAGLFARSLQELTRVDIGFDRDRLLVTGVDPRAAGYTQAQLPALYRRIVEHVNALPGVARASMSASGPFSGSRWISRFEAEGYTRGRDEQLRLLDEVVTTDYFRTVRLTIVHGRAFGPQDVATSRKVSVINETMARRYFQDQSPIGKRWSYDEEFDEEAFEIIGVVQDARSDDLTAGAVNMAYRPVTQTELYLTSIEIRAAGAPAALAAEIRNTLREAEPRLRLAPIEPLGDRVVRAMRQEWLMTSLTMAFGGVALFLACLGLYGTISYAITRRTAELGLRVALGASRGAVQWLILREAFTLVVIGLIVGLPLGFVASRTMATLFFGISPLDPMAHGAAVTALVVIAALAAYLPARRASRVDPMRALRVD
ncbi:MAG: FtsX-like permease family protein [Luteitalea sp.]|nr:FtsX-like permease family protein [Luteitalea sp.]